MSRSVLKALVNVKLAALWSSMSNKQTGKSKKIMYGLLYVFVGAMMIFYFGLMFSVICQPYCSTGLSWFYFGFVSIFALMLCFVGSIFTTQSQLYKATDNDLLLAMPIKPMYILSSRLISVLIWNYVYALAVFIPGGVVYCMYYTPSVMGVIIYVLLSLTVPLLSQSVACVAAYVLELVSSRMRNKNIITLILSMAFLGLYFMFCFRINKYIAELVANGQAIAEAVKKAFFPAYYFGIAVTERDITAVLVMLIISLVPFALVCYVLGTNFSKVVSMKRGEAKKKYVEKKLKRSSPIAALFKKELACFTSSVGYMLNASVGSLFTVILCVALVINKSQLDPFLEIIGAGNGVIAVIGAVFVSIMISMNFVSAPSISLEAKTMWLLKTMPVKGIDVFMAKVYLHCAITAPFALAASLALAIVLQTGPFGTFFLIVMPQVITVFNGFLGVTVNLQLPKFNWTSEVQAIKQGASSFICMFATMVIIIGLCVLYGALLTDIISIPAYTSVVMVLFAALSLMMYLYLRGAGTKKLMEL